MITHVVPSIFSSITLSLICPLYRAHRICFIVACLIQSHPKRLLVLVLVLVWVKAAVRGVATPIKQAGREHYGQGETYLYGLQEGGRQFFALLPSRLSDLQDRAKTEFMSCSVVAVLLSFPSLISVAVSAPKS
jgi:hypothetical protein